MRWGLRHVSPTAPHLFQDVAHDPVTYRDRPVSDLRHSLALGTLMARLREHAEIQREYVASLVESRLAAGGWPAVVGGDTADVATAVYALEFLGAWAGRAVGAAQAREPDLSRHVAELRRDGQLWLSAEAAPGYWRIGVFPKEPWDAAWGTAYLLIRLLAARTTRTPGWRETLCSVAEWLTRDGIGITAADDLVRLRIEARIAAALVAAGEHHLLGSSSARCGVAWVEEWEQRFAAAYAGGLNSTLDLGTAVFAARVFARGHSPPIRAPR